MKITEKIKQWQQAFSDHECVTSEQAEESKKELELVLFSFDKLTEKVLNGKQEIFFMSADPEVKFSTVVIGGGNAGLNSAILATLKQIDKIMVVDVQEPIVYALKALPRINDALINIKKDGQYRQFEKRDKRKNFK